MGQETQSNDLALPEKGESKMFGPGFMSGGGWIIFPIIIMVIMMVFMFMMMSRRGGFGSRRDGPEYRTHSSETQESETPLEILKKRYAKGEIGKEEYEEMKREL